MKKAGDSNAMKRALMSHHLFVFFFCKISRLARIKALSVSRLNDLKTRYI
jgi:hypothetical protein